LSIVGELILDLKTILIQNKFRSFRIKFVEIFSKMKLRSQFLKSIRLGTRHREFKQTQIFLKFYL